MNKISMSEQKLREENRSLGKEAKSEHVEERNTIPSRPVDINVQCPNYTIPRERTLKMRALKIEQYLKIS